ncbi:MAG: DNA methyltransferase [Candidatus Deferrimicrobium sp.]
MPLSWNEIRARALEFSREWADESSEDAEGKSFCDEFFNVFGITRRRVASFEKKVKKIDGKEGYIDLLWKGVLLVEQKSRGKDLDRAYAQATDYFPGLKERDLPRYVLVSDFARFRLYDLETAQTSEFPLRDLHKNIRRFGFIAGYQPHEIRPQDPANIVAAERMGRLYDRLRESGYRGHPLQVYLVRLLFCLFAEDTGIFEKQQFREFIERKTAEDGSDLGDRLATLFHVLNAADGGRLTTLDEDVAAFPYVNGRLFEEPLPPAAFDSAMRQALLDCCGLDWSRISPAIFGSLFQSVMDPAARRNLGAHYTKEENILKLIRPLFLDALRAEFERVRRNRRQLEEFHKKLASLRFLDPACGCGNFLVITYRELRLLELDILRELYKERESGFLDISRIVWLDVDRFHGIEIEEFPAQIAQVALWMTDHQMNLRISEEFGSYYHRLPLRTSPNIVYGPEKGNALRIDWSAVVDPKDLSFILGNPPFVGKKEQTPSQKADVMRTFLSVKGAGVLDYVACWYRKAADYMAGNPAVRAAFVSTNSITQGEQVGILWKDLASRGVQIHFAHRTFQWSSEARGKAAVHCVIIGFALHDVPEKRLFDYETPKSDPHEIRAGRINPYLVDAPSVLLEDRERPLSANAPIISKGSEATDFGHLILSREERSSLISVSPEAEPWIYPFVGGEELINETKRYCLWLVGVPPEKLRRSALMMKRIDAVRQARLASKKARTREWAALPTLFTENRQPASRYLAIPKVSSERRAYIPMRHLDPSWIASGSLLTIQEATLFHFGVLSSTMHMSWMRAVCGRMKSDYQYSAGIVYNNFPWPEPTETQRSAIEAAAHEVLDTRAKFPGSTLADLYDPVATPPELAKAHADLDRAVDKAYGRTVFASEMERVAFLFERYEALTRPLLPPTRSGRRRPGGTKRSSTRT